MIDRTHRQMRADELLPEGLALAVVQPEAPLDLTASHSVLCRQVLVVPQQFPIDRPGERCQPGLPAPRPLHLHLFCPHSAVSMWDGGNNMQAEAWAMVEPKTYGKARFECFDPTGCGMGWTNIFTRSNNEHDLSATEIGRTPSAGVSSGGEVCRYRDDGGCGDALSLARARKGRLSPSPKRNESSTKRRPWLTSVTSCRCEQANTMAPPASGR